MFRLQKAKIIEPVQYSDWAAPIVPVIKEDSSIPLCGDYKLTVNKVAKLDAYPIPKINDLFSKLAGGQRFTTLDMSRAYQQLVLEEESRKYVTITTHKGLFRYNRLQFGVASAPGIFKGLWNRSSKGYLGQLSTSMIFWLQEETIRSI